MFSSVHCKAGTMTPHTFYCLPALDLLFPFSLIHLELRRIMSSFFDGASDMTFTGGQFFTSANKVINNFYSHRVLAGPEPETSGPKNDEQWLNLLVGRRRVRMIEMCDVNMLREVSVQTVDLVPVKSRTLKPTNPFRDRIESQGKFLKVKKRIGSAELVQFGDRRFTVVSFEPENEGDVEKLRAALRPLCEFALSSRLVCFTQIFGVGQSTTPTLIYYDELVDAEGIMKQYRKTPVVFQYLLHRVNTSYDAVVDTGALQKLSIPFSQDLRDWTFNLRIRSFQYNIASNVLSTKCNPPVYFRNRMPSLPSTCNPPLNSSEILVVVPNYLHLLSDLACTTSVKHLSDFIRHGVLTFGAVVDRTKPGILRHFPSIPPPEWYWENYSPDIIVKYSQSVPSHVNLTFEKMTDVQLLSSPPKLAI
ncbi:hypothetical protein E1B28_010541 [Marasmius oreades]|uniref:Uncharacterized protein n=1 Tax=Marasmius oreades TaxID=181124 RepID=A0A9P7RYT2_9AGAR|nr:uncharacterized protein E1B28_010541 [Marasmius oreades]KAG7091513.1 hypothetical protein E1B28_010541 [Marasmius oreades]